MDQSEKIDIKMAIQKGLPKAKIGKHSQDWSIPSSWDSEDPPMDLTEEQLLSSTLLIWREYMLHDEIIPAVSFLKNAPYRIRHHPTIEMVLEKTESTMYWMENLEEQRKGNTPKDPNGGPLTSEAGNPMPGPLTAQSAERCKWMQNRFEISPANTDGRIVDQYQILDLGCMDGIMSNRWALQGFGVIGVDLSTDSIRVARGKATEFSTKARYVNQYFSLLEGQIPVSAFEIVTCSDVYEHLKDPINDILIPAYKHAKSGGKLLLVTPHGSWTRGAILDWAAPWTWAKEGLHWAWGKPRAHLVAPSIWSVAEHVEKAGWWVKNVEVMEQPIADVPGQGNVCVEAIKGKPPTWPGKEIRIVTYENPEKATEMAELLASYGNRVQHIAEWKEEGYKNHVMKCRWLKDRSKVPDLIVYDTELDSSLCASYTKTKSIQLDEINLNRVWDYLG